MRNVAYNAMHALSGAGFSFVVAAKTTAVAGGRALRTTPPDGAVYCECARIRSFGRMQAKLKLVK